MEKLKENIINFIKNYISSGGAKGVVLGMSGGKDSFVVAKLCALAIGPENVFGIIMPNGEMKDLEIAKKECEFLNIKYKVSNINEMYLLMENETKAILETSELSTVSTFNLPPRLRMTLLYSVAATLGYFVAGTSNLSETMIGYSTKWGDNVGDFSPIADLTKTEVCELGLALGLPEELVNKKPEDGLTGKTDEEKIGFSYAELDEFIRTGKISKNHEKIMKMHKVSEHKRALPQKYIAGKENYFNKKR